MNTEGSQIDLLISLLVRFPQIGSVHYEPDKKTLRLVFLLKDACTDDFQDFVRVFQSHLSLFHNLRQEDVAVAALKKIENTDLTIVEVLRDLTSLSLGELNLIIALVGDYYGQCLVQEGPPMPKEDEYEHNMVLESLLRSVSYHGLERLTGFRENGQVLVFSIPDVGVSEQ